MPPSAPRSSKRPTALLALDRGSDMVRVAGLADALFAIVLTLLVLELRLPEASYSSNRDLAAGLLTQLPVLYAYALTFAVGSLHWMAHHRIVSLLRGYDRGLLMWNLLLLGTVSGLPFSSSVVGRNGNLFVGWALYATNMIVIGVVLALLIDHAARRELFRPDVERSLIRLLRLRALAAPLAFVASVPVAAFSTTVAQFMPVLLFVFNGLLSRRYLARSEAAG